MSGREEAESGQCQVKPMVRQEPIQAQAYQIAMLFYRNSGEMEAETKR